MRRLLLDGRQRPGALLLNPTHPEINNGVKCKPTEPIICPPSAPPSPPPAVASPPPTAANKIGYLSSMQMGAYEYRNVHELGGKFTYNYRSGPSTQAEFDYMNANNVEYIPNIPHKWLVLENNETINGWTRPSARRTCAATFRRGLPQPDGQGLPEAGSSICTTQDFVDVLQANQDSFVVKPRRILLQNEPWVGAVQPKSGTELADFYKNELEPALAVVPMDVVLHTSKKSDKCLTVDIEFLKRCDDIGCNFDLATEWSLHHYSQETQEWIDYYTWDTGEWYTDRYAAFAGGYGTRTEQEWKDLLRKFTFLVTETNANWEFTNPIPTNQEYCERVTGQQDTITPGYGIGGVQWALQQDHITGLINWPLWWEWFEGRPAGAAERALSGRLLYNDGTWTPAGKAWLALNDPVAQAAVDCGHDKSPSPPPALALSPPPASPPYARRGCAAWDALGFAARTDLTTLQNVDGSHLTACPQLKQNRRSSRRCRQRPTPTAAATRAATRCSRAATRRRALAPARTGAATTTSSTWRRAACACASPTRTATSARTPTLSTSVRRRRRRQASPRWTPMRRAPVKGRRVPRCAISVARFRTATATMDATHTPGARAQARSTTSTRGMCWSTLPQPRHLTWPAATRGATPPFLRIVWH